MRLTALLYSHQVGYTRDAGKGEPAQVKVTLADLSVTHLHEAKVEIAVEWKVATVGAIVLRGDDAPDILVDTDHSLTRSLLAGRRPTVDNPIPPSQIKAITRARPGRRNVLKT